jgi:hypothetical protein
MKCLAPSLLPLMALVVLSTLTASTGVSRAAQTKQATPAAQPHKGKGAAEPPMANQEVIVMINAGLPEDIIIAKIRERAQTSFDVSTAGLVELKRRGVSDNIIRVMLDPAAIYPSASPSSPLPGSKESAPSNAMLPSEVGVYVRRAGKLADVEPEICQWKTGGILKSMATMGLKGPNVSGYVPGPTSGLELSLKDEIVIMVAEGNSVTEYQLLNLKQKGDRREFKIMSTSVVGAKQSTADQRVAFEHEKLTPRVYLIQLGSLQPGEYGFLPPGLNSESMGSAGKIYSFRIGGAQ